MSLRTTVTGSLLLASLPLLSIAEPAFDAATAFGARPSVESISLSPDGMSVAVVAPSTGQGSVVYVQSLAKGASRTFKAVLSASGKPDRLAGCDWVSNQRLVCSVYGVIAASLLLEPVQFSRLIAVDIDGTKLQLLSTRSNEFTRGLQLGGGSVIDWLPDEDGAVLMTRVYLPDDRTSSRMGSSKRGIAVDRVDTQTLAVQTLEQPREDAVTYISDGRGTIRVIGVRSRRGALGAYDSGNIAYYYRKTDSRDWLPMGELVGEGHNGFRPVAVDHDANLAYGYKKLDGRSALYTIAPVTDLPELKEQHRQWSDFLVVSREIGEGPHVREGSPALNAAKIKVPVLLFHGEMDRNVPIRQSKEMADRLGAAGVPHELVTWPDLDHQLEDSAVRAEMLRKSDAFLRRVMGI